MWNLPVSCITVQLSSREVCLVNTFSLFSFLTFSKGNTRGSFIHPSTLKLLHNSLIYCWRIRRTQPKWMLTLSGHLPVTTAGLGLIFPFFLFHANLNSFSFEFSSANPCPSGCVAAVTILILTWPPSYSCASASMAWILELPSFQHLFHVFSSLFF